MKYQWLEEDLTCEKLNQEQGIKITSITSGDIVIGQSDNLSITRKGVEIEFEQEPTLEQVNKLDGLFSLQKLKREGGRDLVAEIDALKAKVEKLEKK